MVAVTDAYASGMLDRMPAISPAAMPAIFLAHRAPPLIDDAEWVSQLHGWANALPGPSAILIISAHWEERPLTIGATTTVPLVYDFYGFPERQFGQVPSQAAWARSHCSIVC
jgi:4,5-DOPA dioxygenase extradiol